MYTPPYIFRMYHGKPVMIHGSIARDILSLPKEGSRDIGQREGYHFCAWGAFFYCFEVSQPTQDTKHEADPFLGKLIRLIKIDKETIKQNRFVFKLDSKGFKMLYGKQNKEKINYPEWSKQLAYLDGWRFSTYGSEHILVEKIDETPPGTLLLEQMLKEIRAFLEEDPI